MVYLSQVNSLMNIVLEKISKFLRVEFELNEFSLNMITFRVPSFLVSFPSISRRICVCNLISLSMKICVETSPCLPFPRLPEPMLPRCCVLFFLYNPTTSAADICNFIIVAVRLRWEFFFFGESFFWWKCFSVVGVGWWMNERSMKNGNGKANERRRRKRR